MTIEFIARVKCDRPGCPASWTLPVRTSLDRVTEEVTLEPDYPVGMLHELMDAHGREWVECPACYADQDRLREANK